MLLAVFILTIFYGIFFKKNKFYWLWCAILLAIIFNTTKSYPDFYSYNYIFNNINKGDFLSIFNENGPTLWYILCFIFGKIGFAYRGMVVIVIFISMFLINYRIKEIKVNNNIFWALFILFPGIIQCVQLRFFLGTAIILFGLIPLLQNKEGSYVKYIVCILISYAIHSSCIMFSIFLIFPLFNKYGYRKTMIISIFITLVLYFGFQQLIPQVVKSLVSSAKYERYFNSTITTTTFMWFVEVLFVWLSCSFLNTFLLKMINKNVAIDKENKLLSNNIQKAIALLLITIFFMVFDGNFHRFIEIGYVLFYTNISITFNYIKFNKSNLLLLTTVIISIVGIAFYIYTPYDTVTTKVFNYDEFQPILKYK